MTNKKILKNSVMLALGTNISRVLGFARDMLVAFYFGTSDILEAFLVAFRLPNIFRSLLAEDAVDSVVVPVMSEHRDEAYFKVLSGRLLAFAFSLLLIVVVMGVFFAPFIVRIAAPGFAGDPQKMAITVVCVRIVFSYLLFIGLAAQMAGILFVKGRFFVPAFAPVILNVVLIAGVWLSYRLDYNPAYILCWSVIAAGIMQCIFHFLYCRKYIVFCSSLKEIFSDKNIITMIKLFVPRLWSVAVYHINVVVVDTLLASFSGIVGPGAIAAIYYANRFVQFPLATVGLSLSRAALPELSSVSSEDEYVRFRGTLGFALSTVLVLIIPVFFLFIFYPHVFIGIFKSGRFDNESLRTASTVLFFYSCGLIFFAVSRLFTMSFYALKDTATPAKSATAALAVNIVLSLMLMYPLKVGGLALASSIAALVNMTILMADMRKRVGSFLRIVLPDVFKSVISSIVMIVICKAVFLLSFFHNRFIVLFILMSISALVYLSSAYVLKITFFRSMFKWPVSE